MRVLLTSASNKLGHAESACIAAATLEEDITIVLGDVVSPPKSRAALWQSIAVPEHLFEFPEFTLNFLETHQIQAVIPTRDKELMQWSRHKKRLAEAGIRVVTSNVTGLGICLDKYDFFRFLSGKGVSTIKTLIDMSRDNFEKWTVKERFGAGSKGVFVGLDEKSAREVARTLEFPLYQDTISGLEWSADTWISEGGNCPGVVLRTRKLIVGGEAKRSRTFRHRPLEEEIEGLAKSLELTGPLNFQGFLLPDETWVIMECNPRLAGSLVTSIVHGLDAWRWIFLELLEQPVGNLRLLRNGNFVERLDAP